MNRLSKFSIIPLLLLTLPAGAANYWTGNLDNGSVVRVEQQTQKAKIFTDQGATQLWDGVHRMEDGSVIIVREGVVVSGGNRPLEPEAQPSEDPETPSGEPLLFGPDDPACVNLVIKVCGFDGQCNEADACSPARQLLKLEKDEAMQHSNKGYNETSQHCLDALQDETFFQPCESHERNLPSECRKLVDLVCGPNGECTDSEACSPARQLLDMEREEIGMRLRRENRQIDSSKRCIEAMARSDFFTPCKLTPPEPEPAPAAAQD